MHNCALPSPVQVPGLVDAAVRIMVRTVELLTRYHPQGAVPVFAAPSS